MFFTRKSIANALNVPTHCLACGQMVTGLELCPQCHSFYELGLEKLYLEANPDDRDHVHETAYNERLNAWAQHQRSLGRLPTAAQIVAAEQDTVFGVLKDGRMKWKKKR